MEVLPYPLLLHFPQLNTTSVHVFELGILIVFLFYIVNGRTGVI